MTKGDGPGWHRESRRHAEAALNGIRRRRRRGVSSSTKMGVVGGLIGGAAGAARGRMEKKRSDEATIRGIQAAYERAHYPVIPDVHFESRQVLSRDFGDRDVAYEAFAGLAPGMPGNMFYLLEGSKLKSYLFTPSDSLKDKPLKDKLFMREELLKAGLVGVTSGALVGVLVDKIIKYRTRKAIANELKLVDVKVSAPRVIHPFDPSEFSFQGRDEKGQVIKGTGMIAPRTGSPVLGSLVVTTEA